MMAVGERMRGVVSNPTIRRRSYAVLAIVLVLFCIVPRPQVARAKLLPQDSSSAGIGQILSSLGGQLSTFANLLSGGRTPNDLYLIIGRSDAVLDDVVRRLKIVGTPGGYASARQAKLALLKDVDVHLLLGGVLEVETTTYDAERSRAITQAFVEAIGSRIAGFDRQVGLRKREVVDTRFRQAAARVTETTTALDAFKKRNHLASPDLQLGAAVTSRAQSEAQLQAKIVELGSLQQFSGPENPRLRALESEIATLRGQISQTNRSSDTPGDPNLSELSGMSSQYLDLYRDYRLAQSLYEVYARAKEQVEVETLVSENGIYVGIVDPTHLDAQRHFNLPALAALAALIVLALFTEVYAPATGIMLPGMRSPGRIADDG